MNQYPPASPAQLGVRPVAQLSAAFLSQAMFWMFIALLITTGVGVLVANLPPQQLATLGNLWLFIIIGQLVLAFGLSLAINKISATLALLLFFVYAATMGITLGVILLTYTTASVLAAGLSASAVFGAAAVYGYVTKRDLTSVGGILFMGLIGILVASLVNLFIGWTWLNFAIAVLGVVIFTGLTAYDVQRIKNGQLAAFTNSMEKGAVMGAFVLYLDFVNLFFMLLRLFGDRR
jgi:FtsH-binding integral membrane protein